MKSDSWIQKTHLFRRDEYICTACRAVCDKPYSLCPVCGAEKTKHSAAAECRFLKWKNPPLSGIINCLIVQV